MCSFFADNVAAFFDEERAPFLAYAVATFFDPFLADDEAAFFASDELLFLLTT